MMSLGQFFGRYLGGSKSNDHGIPNFYPNLSASQLEQFLPETEFLRIKTFENVYILPFFAFDSEPLQTCFGVGLSKLMIRNLMLLRDVSIHGPEDTPLASYEALAELSAESTKSSYVGGIVDFDGESFSLNVEVHRPSQQVTKVRIQNRDSSVFLEECTAGIARALGSRVNDDIRRAWKVAQPRHPQTLAELGKISLAFEREQLAERGGAALKILETEPDFITAMWEIDEELPYARATYLEGLKRDPYNAQLCFLTFCTVWASKRWQPEALQFCRKAIEISPGHGKAHMCAPHAAQQPTAMLNHSELGYRLLPGNSFAVNNYIIALDRANAPAKRRIELAREGIAVDRHDPGNYLRLIEICENEGEFGKALVVAERLQTLYEPTMNPRALYCLRQNPRAAQLIDAGEFDPAAENRQTIERLRAKIERN